VDDFSKATTVRSLACTPYEEYDLAHTFLSLAEATGIAFLARAEGGLLVASLPESLATASPLLKPGMLLTTINTACVENAESDTEFRAKMAAATAPYTLVFRSTEEHAVLASLFERFMAADRDGSGALDRQELADAVYFVYRAGKKSKKAAVVQQEVDGAMQDFDKDGSGFLEFSEYVEMVCKGPGFQLALSPQAKDRVLALSQLLEAVWTEVEGTPQNRRREWQVQHDATNEIATLRELFSLADSSGDGALDKAELTAVIASYYKKRGVSRNKETLRLEVGRAMQTYDVDGSGTIELAEFLTMFATSSEFSFAAPGLPSSNPEVMALVGQAGQKMRTHLDQSTQAAAVIQAGVRGRLIRAIRCDVAHATLRRDLQGTAYGEYIVTNTWIDQAPLGIKLMLRGEPDSATGVIVSELSPDARLPRDLKPGMLLEAIQGESCVESSLPEVMERMKRRPITVKFRSTLEHAMLDQLVERFLAADRDGSGALDREELTEVLTLMYRREKTFQRKQRTQEEVDQAMQVYDADQSGVLEFGEFVEMVCGFEGFNFKVSEQEKQKVLMLSQLLQSKWATQEGSPQMRRKEWKTQTEAIRILRWLMKGFKAADVELRSMVQTTELASILHDIFRVDLDKSLLQAAMDRELAEGRTSLCLLEFMELACRSNELGLQFTDDARVYALKVVQDGIKHVARITALFLQADVDHSHSLNADELASIFRLVYRDQKISRSTSKVKEEIGVAMQRWDVDGSGQVYQVIT